MTYKSRGSLHPEFGGRVRGNRKYRRVFAPAILEWYEVNGRSFPWRSTCDPFKILIAEVVLKRTGAWKSLEAYDFLARQYGSPDLMANARPSEIAPVFDALGLPSRRHMLIAAARRIVEDNAGKVPNTFDELVLLPGVGRYTANAVLCFAFGRRVPLVDGSVSRVFSRCFDYRSSKPPYSDPELWRLAELLLPDTRFVDYNLGLLDLGALVCKHRSPLHSHCPVSDMCSLSAQL